MKALVFYGAADCKVEQRSMPEITEANEVIVQVKAAGICGSDMAVYTGAKTRKYPLIPGHEFTGRVAAVGNGVEKFHVGDRVVVEPITYCGKCYACRHGRPNVCRSVKTAGAYRDGAMQEYYLTTEDKLFLQPDSLSYRQGALIEPFTIGAQVAMRTGITAGKTVLYHGMGPIGLISMIVAKELGAKCIASELSATRLNFAKKYGVDLAVNPKEENLKDAVMRFTNGRGADIVIDAAGFPGAITQSVDLTADGGTIGNICFAERDVEVDIEQLIKRNITIVGSRLQTYQFQQVIDQYAETIKAVDDIITNVFPIEDAPKAFDLFGSRDENACKIMVEFE